MRVGLGGKGDDGIDMSDGHSMSVSDGLGGDRGLLDGS